MTTILDDAKIYSSHAKKATVDADDVRLAIQCRADQSFTSPPIQQRGVTAYPGLYFIGMPWITTQKSGLLMGVGDDAAHIAAQIAAAR